MTSPATVVNSGIIQTDLCSTQVAEKWASEAISVFPNPFQSSINIYHEMMYSVHSIEIFDSTGKMAFSDSKNNLSINGSIQLNLSHLSTGLYHCIIQTDKENISFSIIKE